MWHAAGNVGAMRRGGRVAPAIVFALLGLARHEAGSAQPVAIVTEVHGSVRIVAHGRSAPPEVADPVERNATVVLGGDARVVLAYPKQGSIYELLGPGRFVAGIDSVRLQSGKGRLARRDLATELRALRIRPDGTTLQGSAVMRGASSLELQAEGPSGSQLARDPIRVCWKPQGAHWSYRLRLIDDDGAILFETRTDASALELPALPLQPNASYLWHLTAQGPDGRSAEAAREFRRVDVDTEQAMLRAESIVLAGADPTERALYQIARQQHGFSASAGSGCAGAARAAPVSAEH
jgi:hypothetical protein